MKLEWLYIVGSECKLNSWPVEKDIKNKKIAILKVSLVDFVIDRSTTEHSYERTILKLCFKKRLKEYFSQLNYF